MNFEREKLRWNGWGPLDQDNALPGHAPQWKWISDTLGLQTLPATPAKDLADLILPVSRADTTLLNAMRTIVGESHVRLSDFERAFHARGKSYHDLLHLRAGNLNHVPDVVLYPETSQQVLDIFSLCRGRKIALIPYGGGSSVVGGVNAEATETRQIVVTLDMTRMKKRLALDPVSMTATFEAGIYGTELEKSLQAEGFTLGHYPQSFEYSTLGGWIGARGAGQQSNRYGKAEKWLVNARVATPKGLWTTENFPASAAGPSLTQLVCGSEGTLGVICEASIKIHPLPESSDYRGYLFRDFASGIEAARQINHAEIPVAMVRLSDADETRFFQAFSRGGEDDLKSRLQRSYLKARGLGNAPCLMLTGLEGERETVSFARQKTSQICRKAGALALGTKPGRKWYHGRFASPYSRDPLMDRGIGIDTLETATPWANITTLHKKVTQAIREAIMRSLPQEGTRGVVMSHVSHSYPDGASLYFTFVFPRDLKGEVAQWQTIKRAASDTIVNNGGTISHHHGVGLDHASWMAEEKTETGLDILKAIKHSLDPDGLMNPGKLLG